MTTQSAVPADEESVAAFSVQFALKYSGALPYAAAGKLITELIKASVIIAAAVLLNPCFINCSFCGVMSAERKQK